MAGKAKSNYLSVVVRDTHKTIMNKMFLSIAELDKFVCSDKFRELYPYEVYYVVKEVY